MKTSTNTKVRLTLDFNSIDDLKDWVFAARKYGLILESSGVFELDGLDTMRDPGVPHSRTYIVRSASERFHGRIA